MMSNNCKATVDKFYFSLPTVMTNNMSHLMFLLQNGIKNMNANLIAHL